MINEEERVKDIDMNYQRKVAQDEFVFHFSEIIAMTEGISLTRRNILRASSSFYTGEVSPAVIQAK